MKRFTFAVVAPAIAVLFMWLLTSMMSWADFGREQTLNEYVLQCFRNTWICAVVLWLCGAFVCYAIDLTKNLY